MSEVILHSTAYPDDDRLRSGWGESSPEYFTTAFVHRPEELPSEITAAELLPVEGPAWLAGDFETRWSDPPATPASARFGSCRRTRGNLARCQLAYARGCTEARVGRADGGGKGGMGSRAKSKKAPESRLLPSGVKAPLRPGSAFLLSVFCFLYFLNLLCFLCHVCPL
jgi:hypothetical protein